MLFLVCLSVLCVLFTNLVRSQVPGGEETATFDDLNVLPATNTGKVGIYKKLNWWGFSALTTAGVDLEVGVMPESSPGMIAFQFPESDRITPTMTISYIKSHIGSFDLKSFHFGCALVTEKFVAGIPKECDVTVMSQRPTARDENATFHFRPTNDLAPMIKAELRSGFSEVQAVTFSVQPKELTVLLDSLVYETYIVGNKWWPW